MHIVTVFCCEIDQSVSLRPCNQPVDRGVEILGERSHLLAVDIIEEEFVLRHAWCDIRWQLTTNAIEGLWGARDQHLRTIRREASTTNKTLTGKEGISLKGLCINHHQVHHLGRALSQSGVVGSYE